jgi:HPr kinase/phosphorylase
VPPGRAPTRTHGTLVEVAGVGVLILGRSGIGKSECALELVMRGNRLVADDIVLIESGPDGRPIGSSPELVRHYLELRGIGIVHVPSMFGETAVSESVAIDLVVQLEAWGAAEIERLGLDRHSQRVGDALVEVRRLPVAPGRNVASLVEVAARGYALQRGGRSGAADLDDRVTAALRKERS